MEFTHKGGKCCGLFYKFSFKNIIQYISDDGVSSLFWPIN